MGSGVVLLVISLLAMLSFNLMSGWTPMGKNFFDWLDYLTSRWMMPLGGIFTVLLAGYALRSEIMRDELNLPPLGYALRSEERRVGKGGVRTGRSRWAPVH